MSSSKETENTNKHVKLRRKAFEESTVNVKGSPTSPSHEPNVIENISDVLLGHYEQTETDVRKFFDGFLQQKLDEIENERKMDVSVSGSALKNGSDESESTTMNDEQSSCPVNNSKSKKKKKKHKHKEKKSKHKQDEAGSGTVKSSSRHKSDKTSSRHKSEKNDNDNESRNRHKQTSTAYEDAEYTRKHKHDTFSHSEISNNYAQDTTNCKDVVMSKKQELDESDCMETESTSKYEKVSTDCRETKGTDAYTQSRTCSSEAAVIDGDKRASTQPGETSDNNSDTTCSSKNVHEKWSKLQGAPLLTNNQKQHLAHEKNMTKNTESLATIHVNLNSHNDSNELVCTARENSNKSQPFDSSRKQSPTRNVSGPDNGNVTSKYQLTEQRDICDSKADNKTHRSFIPPQRNSDEPLDQHIFEHWTKTQKVVSKSDEQPIVLKNAVETKSHRAEEDTCKPTSSLNLENTKEKLKKGPMGDNPTNHGGSFGVFASTSTGSIVKKMTFRISDESASLISAGKKTDLSSGIKLSSDEGEISDTGSLQSKDEVQKHQSHDSKEKVDCDSLEASSSSDTLPDSSGEVTDDSYTTSNHKHKHKKYTKHRKREKRDSSKKKDRGRKRSHHSRSPSPHYRSKRSRDRTYESYRSRDKDDKYRDRAHAYSSGHRGRSRSRSTDRYRHRRKSYSRERSRDRSQDRTRNRTQDRSQDRTRDRSRDRTQDRSRDRIRDRTRDRSRDRRRKRSQDRTRDRSRDRTRNGTRDRSRDRSRDRTRNRSRDRSRDRTQDRTYHRDSTKHRSHSPSRDRHDLRLKIDKAKLREIAIANAKMMQAGRGLVIAPDESSAIDKMTGKSVAELTSICKNLSKKEGDISSSSESDTNVPPVEVSDFTAQQPFIHHPFKLKEQTSGIVMNIKNACAIPIKSPADKLTEASKLRTQFPVSSGTHHRDKESEWVPVERDPQAAKLAAKTAAAQASIQNSISKKLNSETANVDDSASVVLPSTDTAPSSSTSSKNDVFADYPSEPMNVGELVSQRLHAMRKLKDNPHDVQAMSSIYQCQKKMDQWASHPGAPGAFTNKTDAKFLTAQQLSNTNSRNQAWAKKDTFIRAAPVTGGIGMCLLRKMGWKQGEGLGKNNEGVVEPLSLELKIDRKGLKSKTETAQHGKAGGRANNSQKVPTDLSGKHPVSALIEMCNKRRWAAPSFVLIHESGPDHMKSFLFKVIVNGEEFQSSVPSNNKKLAKAQCAAACLQAKGLLPR